MTDKLYLEIVSKILLAVNENLLTKRMGVIYINKLRDNTKDTLQKTLNYLIKQTTLGNKIVPY